MLPEATTKSRLSHRVRLQIRTQKGNAAYFQRVEKTLQKAFPEHTFAVSVLTGSVVIQDADIDLDAIKQAAEEKKLFVIPSEEKAVVPLAKRIALPIRGANRQIRTVSGGALDLGGALFLALLAFGLWELAVGNFKRPPWYTAFWYAFGLFSKTIIDELSVDTD